MKKLLYYILLMYWVPVAGQPFPYLKFSHITEAEGLSNNYTVSIAQDEEGFIWVGTADGLNRLDGYRIRKFFHQPDDTNSIVSNRISEIAPDHKNNLWIATEDGISYYNKLQQRFINFYPVTGQSGNMVSFQYAALHVMHTTNDLVASSIGSVNVFSDEKNYKNITIQIPPGYKLTSAPALRYSFLYEDMGHQLWACDGRSLFLINKTNQQILRTFTSPKEQVIHCLYQDEKKRYWVGTESPKGGKLFFFDPEQDKWKEVIIQSKDRGKYFGVTALHEWKTKNNTKWMVAGTTNGLLLINPESFQYQYYLIDPSKDMTLVSNWINNLFVDNKDILWLATANGVNYVEPSKQLLESWKINNDEDLKIESNNDYIYNFFEDKNEYWLTKWIQNGLFKYNKKGELLKTINPIYPTIDRLLNQRTNKAFSIYKDSGNHYWMSTDIGLVEWNFKRNHAILYTPEDGNENTGLRTIRSINDSILWMRTRNNGPNGIYVFNTHSKRFTQHYFYKEKCSECLPPQLTDLLITKRKDIYTTPVGNYLYKYDTLSNQFKEVFPKEKASIVFPDNSFNCMMEDKAGNIWIGAANGLFAFDPLSKKVFKDFTKNKKIGGVSIEQLCFDDDQNLWMSSSRGLFCLIIQTGEILNFNKGDGLPSNDMSGFLQKATDGYVYAGSPGYVNKFKLSELLSSHGSPDIHISDVEVMDKFVEIKKDNSGRKKITLMPGQNFFSVDFDIVNYDNASGNRYYYKLDNSMKDWKESENGHLPFYNLPGGIYTLRVKGRNKYGEKFSTEDSLSIEIIPHWWQTIWFMIFIIAAIAFLMALFVRRRVQNIKKESYFKQKIAEIEMQALRAQMNPHFIFNSLNSIENFIMQNEKRLASDYLNKFAKLIRMILDSSRNELVPVSRDMEALQLYIDLEQLRFNNKFTYTATIDPILLNGDFKVPSLIIQAYVENAIMHGIAHSEKAGLALSVTAKLENDFIHYSIQDNGIGRRQSSAYNLRNKSKHKSVGLIITQDRIQIFNKQQNSSGHVIITDLYNQANEPYGTRVDVKIKAI